jgi:hypothetical protein
MKTTTDKKRSRKATINKEPEKIVKDEGVAGRNCFVGGDGEKLEKLYGDNHLLHRTINDEIEPEKTVRDLSNGDKSILEDLGIMKNIREKERLEREKNIRYNKKYGFDQPFIDEMMNFFNFYLNSEGKQFIKTAEESLKNSEKEDDNSNIYIKLILFLSDHIINSSANVS